MGVIVTNRGPQREKGKQNMINQSTRTNQKTENGIIFKQVINKNQKQWGPCTQCASLQLDAAEIKHAGFRDPSDTGRHCQRNDACSRAAYCCIRRVAGGQSHWRCRLGAHTRRIRIDAEAGRAHRKVQMIRRCDIGVCASVASVECRRGRGAGGCGGRAAEQWRIAIQLCGSGRGNAGAGVQRGSRGQCGSAAVGS
jgi:hypothetical protein